MSIEEMKAAAIEKIISLEAEKELEDVLEYLSHLSSGNEKKIDLSIHYSDIKSKYGDVLKRLAE